MSNQDKINEAKLNTALDIELKISEVLNQYAKQIQDSLDTEYKEELKIFYTKLKKTSILINQEILKLQEKNISLE